MYGSLGFAFQVSVLGIFGGAKLFILGIMGEYLARMFNRRHGSADLHRARDGRHARQQTST